MHLLHHISRRSNVYLAHGSFSVLKAKILQEGESSPIKIS